MDEIVKLRLGFGNSLLLNITNPSSRSRKPRIILKKFFSTSFKETKQQFLDFRALFRFDHFF